MATETQIQPQYLEYGAFVDGVAARIRSGEGDSYALVSLDFDNFNFINDLFTYAVGDEALRLIALHLCAGLEEGEYLTRVHADHYILWMRGGEVPALMTRLRAMAEVRAPLEAILPAHYNLVCSGGIAYVTDQETPFTSLLDRANVARKLAKGNYVNTFLCHDETMAQRVQWQKMITLTMEPAMQRGEFVMYLQPKVLMKTGQLVGAEALVRWQSREYGMISPDRFIPIMEQNGYIRQLDFFMLETACRYLKRSMDEGRPALPISVNFSKMHLRRERFAEKVARVVDRFGLPPHLIEVEFTESIFSGDFQKLARICGELKAKGFRVALDDFGSAYSSLNCLKDIPLDSIKIDKAFLQASTNTDKGRIIISKVVELIKSLRMVSVIEGVETEEQVEFLKRLSCDLGQGFFFGRPMPEENYTAFVEQNSCLVEVEDYLRAEVERTAPEQVYLPKEFEMDSWELYTLGQNIDMGLMKGRLDEQMTVEYTNGKALEYLGYSRKEFQEELHNSILAFLHMGDVARIRRQARRLRESGQPLPFRTRAVRKDGKVITLQGRASCVMDGQGKLVGIYAFQDVTGEMERTARLQHSLEEKIALLEQAVHAERDSREALRVSEERYRLVVEQSDDILFDWDFGTDSITFSEKYEKILGEEPYCRDVRTNPAIRGRIKPDDLGRFEQWLRDTYRQPTCVQVEFRIQSATGRYVWMRVRSTPILDREGRPIRAVGTFSNIDKQKREVDSLTLKSQRDPLTGLFNKTETQRRIEDWLDGHPAQPAAFFIIDVDNFKGVNDNLGHQMGDAVLIEVTQKVRHLFRAGDVVGRIGGDELVVFARGFARLQDLKERAESLVRAIRGTYFGATTQYAISGSVGIACCPANGQCFDDLYALADTALYESKDRGKDCYTIYQEQLMSNPGDSHTPVEGAERFLRDYFENDFIYSIFEMLYETRDTNASIERILELVGRHFAVDRTYIFQYDEDGAHISETFSWCDPDVGDATHCIRSLPLAAVQDYLDGYTADGIYACNDVASAHPGVRDMLAQRPVASFLHCAIRQEGRMWGFVGFDMHRAQRIWRGDEMARLGYLSRILSVFLQKSQVLAALTEAEAKHREVLGSLSDFVYVIDVDSYQLLYTNRASERMGIRVGEACYWGTFRRSRPCPNCPVRLLSEETNYATEEVYLEQLGCWASVSASRVRWEGHSRAALLCCTDISKYKEQEEPWQL